MIGISGAIASGKTFVAELLARELGAAVISADAIAHDVLARDPHVRQEIIRRWGNACLDENGEISRARLARIVFDSSDDLAELNRIIQPAILRRIADEIDSARRQGSPWIVLDAALLFETGLDTTCDIRIFVESDWTIRAERARRDRGWTEDDLRRRDAAQLPVQQKITFSDYIVNNNRTKDETKRQIENIVTCIKRHRRTNNGKQQSE
ncbi:MAG TPA: dephospho-CoA kinase [Planctomycetota bacterium]|nr:dephospho-CoA kinase [Planctomycetota bacterium]